MQLLATNSYTAQHHWSRTIDLYRSGSWKETLWIWCCPAGGGLLQEVSGFASGETFPFYVAGRPTYINMRERKKTSGNNSISETGRKEEGKPARVTQCCIPLWSVDDGVISGHTYTHTHTYVRLKVGYHVCVLLAAKITYTYALTNPIRPQMFQIPQLPSKPTSDLRSSPGDTNQRLRALQLSWSRRFLLPSHTDNGSLLPIGVDDDSNVSTYVSVATEPPGRACLFILNTSACY